MELNHDIIDTPPRDSASVVMLRYSADGLQVLLMRRHTDSAVLGGAYVFPGGKVDAADSAPEMLALLDRPMAELHARVAEPALSPEQAAAFYVAPRARRPRNRACCICRLAPPRSPSTAPPPASACAPANPSPPCWPSTARGSTPTPSLPGCAGSRRAGPR